ncbi:excinuclease ABC subunit UvrC [bacterium]|nr:excinuclease ABC subunit UvrC [bacterium]
MQKSDKLKNKLEALPDKPGVYIFKDSRDEIIYVGKAKSLRSRVRSYFSCADDGRYQYPRLIASIRDLDIILTSDEVEALATEAALIKKHSPKYNVDLRDDKSFPYLMITREAFPRITLTRKLRTENADYYGPFTNARETRNVVRTLKGILQICDCNLPLIPEKIAKGKYKLCLDYHIGRCGGPCIGIVSESVYKKNIERFLAFLNGRHDKILKSMQEEMQKLAAELKFEDAAAIRDRLSAAQLFCNRQRKVSQKPVDRDGIGLAREDSYAAFSVIKVRGGRIVGQSPFHMERAAELDDAALMEAFLIRHYNLVDRIPPEVCIQNDIPGIESLALYLSGLAKRVITVKVPKRGEKKVLVLTAARNAEQLLLERRLMAEKRDFIPRSIKSMQEILNLPEPPLRIEAFDISNLQGSDSVASMVCFKDGKPKKSEYRIFKIKTVEGIDDFASIGEAVKRRYNRLKSEIEKENLQIGDNGKSETSFPDLVLIDGGKGQLSSAVKALDEIGLSDLPIVGLAKRLDEIFLPGQSESILLPRSSTALRLLQQVRDEAHRFAITRHRLLRGKRQIKSKLDNIPSVGLQRRQALLKKFGSLKRIAAADIDEIAETVGISRKLAEMIKINLNE